jgi:hypothetical protein
MELMACRHAAQSVGEYAIQRPPRAVECASFDFGGERRTASSSRGKVHGDRQRVWKAQRMAFASGLRLCWKRVSVHSTM